MPARKDYTTPRSGLLVELYAEIRFAWPAPRAHPAEDSSPKRGEVMLSQEETAQPPQILTWPIGRFVFYARNPRKNDAAVDRMCASIREFGFKIPVLARSNGTVVDGHLRLKAARKLGSWPGGDITCIPVILCDEWSDSRICPL